MTIRPPVQFWQLVGTSLLCGVAVLVATALPHSLGEIVSLATWSSSLVLISVGAVSLIRHSPRLTQWSVVGVSLLFGMGTSLLLPSAWTLIAALMTGGQLLLLSGLTLRNYRQPPISPSRVAIKVTSKRPSTESQKKLVPEDSKPLNELENETINAGLEQALLSRLSVAQNHEEDSPVHEEESPHNSQSIQFQPAESHILQRYERGLDPEGREWLEGTIRVDFIRNQKTAVIHIPFWPAFQFPPQVNSELLEGPHLKIDIKTVERWGIRLELTRRAAGLDPDSAELAFFVTTESKARGAA
ncbi:MAG: hypothetical protein P8M30_17595 [Planctomycetaceae bacterium]|jgi:hypothetical protein|nr:hypothetical protein [bacterium]MDG2391125.1 hypothetical protein [Planctomycetaceae bacterium]